MISVDIRPILLVFDRNSSGFHKESTSGFPDSSSIELALEFYVASTSKILSAVRLNQRYK